VTPVRQNNVPHTVKKGIGKESKQQHRKYKIAYKTSS